MPSVALIEDDELVRVGLADWLASVPGFQVASSASSADQALIDFERSLPDIALVDILLPGISGIELVRRMKTRWPKLQAIMLSGSATPELVLEAFAAGARGYLPKVTTVSELGTALREVVAGRWYLSPQVTEGVLEKARQLRAALHVAVPGGAVQTDLEPRERELLKLIAEGHTFSQIAKSLGVSSRSVERLKAKLEEKLKATTLADLVRRALELEIIAR